jgi:hypothetical protein
LALASPLTPAPVTQDAGTGGFTLRSSSTYAQGLDLNYGECAIEPSVTPQTVTFTQLDAGPVINVSGPNGAKMLAQLKGFVGSYGATLGGGFAAPGQTPPPLYLAPGTYSVDNGQGGKDVGAFKFNLTVPPPLTWTNFPSNNTISRSSPLTVSWTGGDPNSDVDLTGSSGVSANASVTFICRARVSDGSITVPVSILQALPVTATVSGVPVGGLALSTGNPGAPSLPSGLDLFSTASSQGFSETVTFQ